MEHCKMHGALLAADNDCRVLTLKIFRMA